MAHIAHRFLLSVFFITAAADTQNGVAHCSQTTCADTQDSIDVSELSLLQTDVTVHRRSQKKDAIRVQSEGVVDAEKASLLQKEAAKEEIVGTEMSLLQTDLTVLSRARKGETIRVQSEGIMDIKTREEAKDFKTTTSWHKPKSRAEASGVKTNGAGDMSVFLVSLVMNLGMVACTTAGFMVLKGWYPQMYSNNLKLNAAPLNALPAGAWGWWKASYSATTEQVMDNVGLDQAMLLEFTNLAMRIMLYIGVPMFLFVGPMNYLFGGHAAGMDHLSCFSFGNVVNGSQLYWFHALLVWGVAFIVQHSVNRAQALFVPLRYKWLRELPNPRNNTILVEGIPDDHLSEEKLKEFFEKMFGQNKVKSTYIVKAYDKLEASYANKVYKTSALEKAQDDTERSALKTEISSIETEIKTYQADVKKRPEEFNCSTGFVSFNENSDVALALSVQLSADADDWQVSIPPTPSSILWKDLQQGDAKKTGWALFGYALTAALFMVYMPCVVNITQVAVTINMGAFQPMWAAFAPTMGLQFMVAFLPTFLILIFRLCFTLKDDAYAQQILQNWYFIFQVVFVILVTAIGSGMVQFLETLVEEPLEIFPLLGKTMPFATHFYMNYMVLQWSTHTMVLTRYIQLTKYLFFKRIFDDDEYAREMSEPEDQDYYGIGSRSCRLTTNLCIGIIYGTLCPPINVLTFIEFAICRIVYGYLIPFAETKKPDLGGLFWVQQLRHVMLGNILYCILMTGVLLGRARTNGPGVIAACSFVWVFYSMRKFEKQYSWEKLPFKELKSGDKGVARKEACGEYVQPFMKSVK
jgi:hypothetical protein